MATRASAKAAGAPTAAELELELQRVNYAAESVCRELRSLMRLRRRTLPRLEQQVVQSSERLLRAHLVVGFLLLLGDAVVPQRSSSYAARLCVLLVSLVALFQSAHLQDYLPKARPLKSAPGGGDGAACGDSDSADGAEAKPLPAGAAFRSRRAPYPSLRKPMAALGRITRRGGGLLVAASQLPRRASEPPSGGADGARPPTQLSRNVSFAAALDDSPAGKSASVALSVLVSRQRGPQGAQTPQSIPGICGEAGGRKQAASKQPVDGIVILHEAEATAVEALRARLGDVAGTLDGSAALDLGDAALVRFARARRLNVDNAEKLFRGAVAWRAQKRPLQVHARLEKGPRPELYSYVPGGWAGFDREGAPVWIDRLGQLDVAGVLQRAEPEHIEELSMWRLETNQCLMAESEARTGRPQYQMCVVQDLTGLSLRHFNRDAFRFLKISARINDAYYPEQLKVCFVVNAPRIFAAIWTVVSRFFEPDTRAKIQIHSGCPTDLLLQHIDADTLPKFLGGNRVVDGDPFCSKMIQPGGKIPPEVPPLPPLATKRAAA